MGGADPNRRPRVPRGVVIGFSVVSWLLLFAIAPWEIGRRGRKLGWRRGRPSALNRLAVAPLGLGAMGLGWCLAVHYVPGEEVPVSLVPENLIARGPYRLSRNPMYVCEQMVLLGWTLYFGNAGLLAASTALGAGMRYAVIREERTLARRFGGSWYEYAAKVPRWM